MSELQVTWGSDSGTEGQAIPAASEACVPAAALTPPAVTTGAAESFSLLKRVISFPAMLGMMLVGAVFIAGRMFAVDPDLWWHVKAGQDMLATHHWPTTDPFSFTVAGQPWIAMEWLGDVLFATVARLAGLQGLDGLLIILGGAVVVALYAYGTLRSGNSKAGFVAAATLLVLANASFSLRPQMFGYLFLIVALIALELFRQGKKWAVWILPPLLLVWVNTHGSWIVGLGVIAVYWVAGLKAFRLGGIEARRWTVEEGEHISFAFLLSLIAITLTPYGTRLAVFPFGRASSYPISDANILEWLPMPFNLPGGKFFLALVLAFFLLQTALNLVWRLEELVLFLGGAAMACLHVRFLLIFVPFFAPLLATILARWLAPYSRSKDRYVLNGILIACLAAAMFHYFPSRADLENKIAQRFPVKAVEYLRQHAVSGPMFNSYNFGGYLIWSLGPERKVFVDGRSEIYEDGGSLADYFHITHLQQGALAVLRSYGIQACLVERDAPLATMLSAQPEWRKVYADNLSVLFVRRDAATSPAPTRGSTLGQKE